MTNLDEESVAMEEVKALGEAVKEVELSVQGSDVAAALDGNARRWSLVKCLMCNVTCFLYKENLFLQKVLQKTTTTIKN